MVTHGGRQTYTGICCDNTDKGQLHIRSLRMVLRLRVSLR